ncbi:molecular chaperone Tir [Oscillatoriales cyanobacterium USR001]|nr:molecular chaperone Tir [Oscillatoriales cyanobacterium USR001]
MPRSLRVREECISVVKSALLRNGFPSQKILAEDLGIAQSTVSNFLNGKPVDYANFAEICRVLAQEWRDIADFNDYSLSEETRPKRAKIAIAYSSDSNSLAQYLQQALIAASHEVFLGKNCRLDSYLKLSDYLLLLLSEESAIGEMVLAQVQLVLELQHLTPQKPAILPIFVDFFPDVRSLDLLSYLEGIQPWAWRCADDSSMLASEIAIAIAQGRTSLNPNHKLAVNLPIISPSKNTTKKQHYIQSQPVAEIELPGGQVSLISNFYIERYPIESRCYETISQPGALIRIKAPRQMGKTSLMSRILHHAEQEGSRTVALSFQLANKRIFANSDTFLQWFCACIGQELGMLDQLVKCWQLADIIGSNQCCKAYFEQYLLSETSASLTLGLDEVDRVFESPEIADDFFGLLRALHEEAKRRDIWKKFRLVVVHSTEVYIPLDVNKSPFNVGLPIDLPEFNLQQVQELAKRHGLVWSVAEIEELLVLIGGHPYLIRLAMYYIARQDVSLNQLVKNAPTEAGIYSDHLRRHLWNLEKYPPLMEAMREIVTAVDGVRLRSDLAFKLNSMGLVKIDGNNCTARCNLYQQYFRDRLS